MKTANRSKHFLPCIFFIIVPLLLPFFIFDIFAISPSFSREEVLDHSDDWYNSSLSSGITINGPECMSNLVSDHYSPPDISSVSYSSDGRFLNATLWLSNSPYARDVNFSAASVDLTVENLTERNESYDTFTKTKLEEISDEFDGMRLINTSETTLPNRTANKFVFTYNDGENRTAMHIWIMDGKRAYGIKYDSLSPLYSKYLPEIEEMAQSFKILPSLYLPTNVSDIPIPLGLQPPLPTLDIIPPLEVPSPPNSSFIPPLKIGSPPNDISNSNLFEEYYSLYDPPHQTNILIQIPKGWEKTEYNFDSSESEDTLASFYSPSLHQTWDNKRYTMIINTKSSFTTGSTYAVLIKWEKESNTWTKYIYETAANGQRKILDIKQNISLFDDKYNREKNPDIPFLSTNEFIPFSFDLESINLPSEYAIIFTATDDFEIEKKTCIFNDSINWIPIPTPEYNITVTPSSLELRPGDEKKVELQITPKNVIPSHLSISSEDVNNIKVKIIPNETKISSITGVSTIHIKATENASLQQYVIPIHINFSFQTPLKYSNDPNAQDPTTNTPLERLSKSTNIIVSVLPPEYNITVTPSSLELRPGDEKDIAVVVKSETNLNSFAALYTRQSDPLEVRIIPNATYIPPLGYITPNLHIKARNNLSSKPYTFQLVGNISFLNVSSSNLKNNSLHYIFPNYKDIVKSSDISVSILPKLTVDQQFNNFINTWINPANGLWTFLAAIGAVIAPIAVRQIKKNRKGDDQDTKK